MKFISSVLVFVFLAVVVDRCFSDDTLIVDEGLQQQGDLIQDQNQQLSGDQIQSNQGQIEPEDNEDWGEEGSTLCQRNEDCLESEICYKNSCFARVSGN